ncbi:type II toxin-antitoxin system PemK/MazF family toxin [endosymbiont GvMRE of Glomus versiforme]|uniref:type II toxin-antitoxin system PemK/MazF family toxin n=1 Tax=endosymbiont GvMRE of Glomus versiforme TaxID=2039283 RepID=UPI000EC34272|nr:type II toxin-antitoxin system PemK/MazF family toxin [endosymbiont GvMRE of Glomus versiforme]RHZ35941.1 mRNA interferase [endosymbiont GvMRE of Glomus versiforme]
MSSLDFPQEGEIWLVKFEKLKEFSKPYRPCLIVSNNTQNQFDKNIVVVGLTTEEIERIRTFEVFIENTPETGLTEPSKICCNYLHTVNKKLRLIDKKPMGVVNPKIMAKVKKALKIVLNL